MNCFPCFRSQKSMKPNENKDHETPSGDHMVPPDTKKLRANDMEVANPVENRNSQAKTFTFRELATATKNFRQECLIGEGGSGRVYKGTLTSTGQVVAVKQLDRHGFQGGKDFHTEVSVLSLLRHENLVNLIGYCADGDQRVLVYEFMSGGTLQEHLLDRAPEKKPLDWFTRMKIAFGTAKGLEYLHDQANPPVIFRDLKPSNILLTEDLTAKLSDYGLAKLSPSGDNSPISSRMMGTYGYAAPEYNRSGHFTMKSDVYSFGVVFLEILTGRRAMDTTRPINEQNLVTWATPMFRDPKRFPDLADPLLEMRFPEKDLNQAVAIAAMCLQEEPGARPLISDVVVALSFLSVTKEIVMPNPPPPVTIPPVEERAGDNDQQQQNEAALSGSDDDKDSGSSHDEDEDEEEEEDKNSEGGESVDNESEVNESDYQYSNSYSKRQVSSLRKSTKKRGSSKHGSISRSQNKGGSALRKTSQVSRDRSISSSESSSRSSQDGDPLLSQKSSKLSRHALSHKSSRGADDSSHCSSSRTSSSSTKSRSRDPSMSGDSSRKSRSRDPSMSRGSSINSCDGIRMMSHKSSRKSRTKSTRRHDSSDHGSEDGGLSSIHGSSRGSDNESFHHLDHTNSESYEEGCLLLL